MTQSFKKNEINMQKSFSQPAGRKEKITSRIRSIGNSKGVILNNQLMQAAGLNTDADITLQAGDGIIIIAQAKPEVNTDLKTWEAQFKKAIKAGAKPEKDLFEGLANDFDKTEW